MGISKNGCITSYVLFLSIVDGLADLLIQDTSKAILSNANLYTTSWVESLNYAVTVILQYD